MPLIYRSIYRPVQEGFRQYRLSRSQKLFEFLLLDRSTYTPCISSTYVAIGLFVFITVHKTGLTEYMAALSLDRTFIVLFAKNAFKGYGFWFWFFIQFPVLQNGSFGSQFVSNVKELTSIAVATVAGLKKIFAHIWLEICNCDGPDGSRGCLSERLLYEERAPVMEKSSESSMAAW